MTATASWQYGPMRLLEILPVLAAVARRAVDDGPVTTGPAEDHR